MHLRGNCSLFVGLLAAPAFSAQYLATDTTTARNFLDAANPGDTVLLAPGDYDNLTIEQRSGVTLRSQFATNPATIRPVGPASPALYIGFPQNITVQDLVIDFSQSTNLGYGINADQEGQATFGSGLTLRNITVKMTAPTGNYDGFHMSGVQNFLIEGCHIQNWGTDGAAIDTVGAHDGIIRNNYFSGAYNSTGAGIQMKGGARNIVVRANRLQNAGNRAISFGGNTDLEYFEPGITFEAKDLIAEGNVIVGGYAPIAFAGSIGGEFRRNVSYNTARWLGRILDEGQSASGFPTQVTGGKYIDNRLMWTISLPEYVNVSGSNDYADFTFARNQWYHMGDPAHSTPTFPSGITETGGIYGVDPQINPDKIVPWTFSWGAWLVNASLSSDTLSLTGLASEPLYLAVPGNGATVDMSAAFPLIGSWTFQPVSGTIAVGSLTDAILIRQSLVPEPAAGLLLLPTLSLLGRRRRC